MCLFALLARISKYPTHQQKWSLLLTSFWRLVICNNGSDPRFVSDPLSYLSPTSSPFLPILSHYFSHSFPTLNLFELPLCKAGLSIIWQCPHFSSVYPTTWQVPADISNQVFKDREGKDTWDISQLSSDLLKMNSKTLFTIARDIEWFFISLSPHCFIEAVCLSTHQD